VKLGPVRVDEGEPLPAGRLAVTKNAVHVGTGTARVRLGDVTPKGRRKMAAADWARGARVEPDASFT
jgi:methionyl-tRNA formyltransferase